MLLCQTILAKSHPVVWRNCAVNGSEPPQMNNSGCPYFSPLFSHSPCHNVYHRSVSPLQIIPFLMQLHTPCSTTEKSDRSTNAQTTNFLKNILHSGIQLTLCILLAGISIEVLLNLCHARICLSTESKLNLD